MNEEVKGGAGSTVESWLEEEGLLEEANAAAIKSVLTWQRREEMRARGITKTSVILTAKGLARNRSETRGSRRRTC
jgi:antitoxin HicB